MIENEQRAAEAQARKNRKGPAAERMANTARLAVLEKHLGIKIKRHKDPGKVTSTDPNRKAPEKKIEDKEEVTVVKSGF